LVKKLRKRDVERLENTSSVVDIAVAGSSQTCVTETGQCTGVYSRYPECIQSITGLRSVEEER
jgi:hypothetical protein